MPLTYLILTWEAQLIPNVFTIFIKELKAAMVSLGFESKNAVIFQMISDLDADGNGNIDFPEFVSLMTNRVNEKDTRQNFNKIFNLFDD
jgi:calmodulin